MVLNSRVKEVIINWIKVQISRVIIIGHLGLQHRSSQLRKAYVFVHSIPGKSETLSNKMSTQVTNVDMTLLGRWGLVLEGEDKLWIFKSNILNSLEFVTLAEKVDWDIRSVQFTFQGRSIQATPDGINIMGHNKTFIVSKELLQRLLWRPITTYRLHQGPRGSRLTKI